MLCKPSHQWHRMQVMSKELKEHGYYKKKGLVEKLASKFVGRIAMLDTGDVLQVCCVSLPQSALMAVKALTWPMFSPGCQEAVQECSSGQGWDVTNPVQNT